ncbi:hypothetical protein GCM10025768_02160 [Microbacterium pseudoresistens]|uniref:Adhesin domain-containing protein n=1 Tax=Microbacterium pseudoresistens TaxID=640634 RepID=A0A7Y9JMI0_9MICO|nr:DUF4097 family beta strand repeat-containing protein [Microbacterium pseudoresistens]NYD54051.1 hypothetical protein [Microbacterium pseudoresistens]
MTNTPLTPPAAANDPAPAASASTPPPAGGGHGGAGTVITIVAAVVGGFALIGATGGAAVAATGQFVDDSASHGIALDAAHVTDLELRSGGAEVTVRFADVDDAQLVVDGHSRGDWTMARDGDTLRVASPRGVFSWLGQGWWFGDETRVTLTLPDELSGVLDADFRIDAGQLTVHGAFDELDLRLSAGSMRVEAEASSVEAEVNAGAADLTLDGVKDADLTMSAGTMTALFTGAQPDELDAEVSAGSMRITVPRGEYALQRDVSAGRFDSEVDTNGSSPHRITAKVSAGGLTIEAQR